MLKFFMTDRNSSFAYQSQKANLIALDKRYIQIFFLFLHENRCMVPLSHRFYEL